MSRIPMKRIRTIILAASMAGLLTTQPGLAQSSVEDGIADLAQQIVQRSASADKTTIAISAFPHVDNTCSELSNYLADELVLSLFGVPGNSLSIVERSQLDRIFSEIELSMSGAVDANTTQELGRIAGVDTLLVGSITEIGDEIRVNARMIDTETAQVFSAAAVNIPQTETTAELFASPATGGCGMASGRDGGQPSAEAVAASSGLQALPGLSTDFNMADMVGRWSGSRNCSGIGDHDEQYAGKSLSEPRTMILSEPSPSSLRVRYFMSATYGGSFQNYTLNRNFAKEDIWFTLPAAGGISLKLVAEGVLFGEYTKKNDEDQDVWACTLQFGQISG